MAIFLITVRILGNSTPVKENVSAAHQKEERKKEILDLLEKQNKVFVPDLCDFFNVSPATIRTDLRILDNEGLLKRTHGGAVKLSKATYEPTSDFKLSIVLFCRLSEVIPFSFAF